MYVVMCVCIYMYVLMCVCVYVCEREREREKPIVSQMVKKLSFLCRTRGFIIASSRAATCLYLEINAYRSRPPILFLRSVKYYTTI